MNESRWVKHVVDSAIDWWVAALLLLTPGLSAIFGIALMLQQRPTDASILFLCGALAIAVTALFTVPCRYTLLDDTLNIRCGVLFYSIPLQTIQRVELSSSWLSGPALSLRRIEIEANGRRHLISPKNREAFFEELNSRLSEIRIHCSPSQNQPS